MQPFAPRDARTELRIDELLSKMTLEEKVGQLHQVGYADEKHLPAIKVGQVGSVCNMAGAEKSNRFQRVAVEESRLGIPLLMGRDVIHGYRTVFPIPLGQAAGFDPELVRSGAALAAAEARADGIAWTFAPMLDIARDGRWGRIAEGLGEDTYLCSALARAMVQGFQGAALDRPDTVLACAKHYAAYGAAEGGRDYNTADISERTLREVYLPPFQAAVEAGVGSFMSAFNEIAGVPAAANRFLLTTVLREQWGFDGFVVSDWNALNELLVHGCAADEADAAGQALAAGVDLDMVSECFLKQLPPIVRAGKVSEKLVDQAVRRLLRLKFALGLFDKPYTDPKLAPTVLGCAKHVAAARQAAGRTAVLLKNADLLPLGKSAGAIAVVGPMAGAKGDLFGCWTLDGRQDDAVSVLDGITAAAGKGTKVCAPADGSTEAAVKCAAACDVVVAVVGENPMRSGEGHCLADIVLPEGQEALLKALHATGKPVIAVVITGRPLILNWLAENLPAILLAFHPGGQGGNGIADVLFGTVNPAGRLPVSFPRATGQIPIHYNHKNTGRPAMTRDLTSQYLDVTHTPLYPFGFGLSYTRFEYANLSITPGAIPATGSVTVSADVTNTGTRDGEEVVQLYIHDVVGSVTRPVKELRGFQRLTIPAGQTSRVTFTLGAKELAMLNRDMKLTVEPGKFQVWVGPNSAEGIEGAFEVV